MFLLGLMAVALASRLFFAATPRSRSGWISAWLTALSGVALTATGVFVFAKAGWGGGVAVVASLYWLMLLLPCWSLARASLVHKRAAPGRSQGAA